MFLRRLRRSFTRRLLVGGVWKWISSTLEPKPTQTSESLSLNGTFMDCNEDFGDLADEDCNATALFETYNHSLLYFGAFVCIVACIFGVLGNIITAAALIKCRSLHNATTAFILNLCLSDCLYCAIVTPLIGSNMINETWNYSETLCILQAFMQFLTRTISAFTIGVIAINRYVLIIHSDSYRKIYTKRNIILIIIAVWIVALSCFVPTLTSSWGTYGFSKDLGICTLLHVTEFRSAPITVFSVIAFTVVGLACCILYCYLRIYYAVRNISRKLNVHRDKTVSKPMSTSVSNINLSTLSVSNASNTTQSTNGTTLTLTKTVQRQQQYQDMEMRVLKVSLAIFCVFFLSFAPIVIIRLAQLEDVIPTFHILAYLCLSIGACMNPLIYVVFSREYRHAYKTFVLCNKDKTESNAMGTPSARFYVNSAE